MIDLKFLGTGGIGSVRPRNKLSRDYRRFATLLINEAILIDPSEDIFEFESTFMLPGLASGAKDVFITHSHIDRFSPLAIEKLARGGGVRVYASPTVIGEIGAIRGIEAIPIEPFGLVRVGAHTVVALPANHSTEISSETAYNYLIDSDGTTVFYALDGAWIPSDSFKVLKEAKLSAIVFDFGAADSPFGEECACHNNLEMVKNMIKMLESCGACSEKTKIFLSNVPMGRKHPNHEQLSEIISQTPYKLAYDGYFTII